VGGAGAAEGGGVAAVFTSSVSAQLRTQKSAAKSTFCWSLVTKTMWFVQGTGAVLLSMRKRLEPSPWPTSASSSPF
jgi:hypothetical protein